ncbi:MAG: hypothetical protein PHG25_04075 [Candidatus Pacebacteria bacterium]|nr:hypothetical protein [Candidatus Paceibacterota bacterium]
MEYKPEITIDACRGCNYAEYLIRHPEIKSDYYMTSKMKKVREWTLRNRPLIQNTKPKSLYNAVDATKMPGETRFERNINAVKQAEKMYKENPNIESTYVKWDTTGRDEKLKLDDDEPNEYRPGIINI